MLWHLTKNSLARSFALLYTVFMALSFIAAEFLIVAHHSADIAGIKGASVPVKCIFFRPFERL
jgi:hypothetical protein